MSKPADLVQVLDEVPPYVAVEHDCLDDRVLPPEVRTLAGEVRTARELWQRLDLRRREARAVAASAEADHRNAQVEAARAGTDPATITDQRAQRRAEAAEADASAAAARQALGEKWWSYMRAVEANRDTIADTIAAALTDAQHAAETALRDFRVAEQRQRAALGLLGWLDGARVPGAFDGCSTIRGPRTVPPTIPVRWLGRNSRMHTATIEDLLAGVTALAKGSERYRAERAQSLAITARAAGDPAAQRKPVPSGVLRVG